MPLPPCFRLAQEVFPAVRAEAARRLVARGWSQTRVAEAVGLSQGMVSKHAAGRPRRLDPLAARLVDELMADLDAGTARAPSGWCRTLGMGDGRPGGAEALHDLLDAEQALRAAAPLRLMPQIGLNLARALPDAKTPEDILSYPGRLVDVGGDLVPPAPPAFGASGHLARCLLALRRRDPGRLAIANVRGGADARRRAQARGIPLRRIPPDPKGDSEAALARLAERADEVPDLLLDDETPGTEPCLYVTGRSARDVARLILRLEGE